MEHHLESGSAGYELVAGADRPGACVVAADPSLSERMTSALEQDGIEVLTAVAPSRVDLELTGLARRPEVVVVALERGERAAFGVLRDLRLRFGQSALMAVAPAEDSASRRRVVRSAMRAGVVAMVPDNQVENALGPAARTVLAGLVVVPRGERALITPDLSPREREVLALVVAGYGNAEVAQRLYLAESTVKSHLTSAFAKLGVSSRGEATTLILDPHQSVGRTVLSVLQHERSPLAGTVRA